MDHLLSFNEKHFDSLGDVDGYIDANELVGQRLWFHTNRTHRNQHKNGMIGIYNASKNGYKTGYAGQYTNQVRLGSPIVFQTSERGAEVIKQQNKRFLIAGVSGTVLEMNEDISDMSEITYNPFGNGYFHLMDDEREIISSEEVYFNASEDGKWDIYVKNPIYE